MINQNEAEIKTASALVWSASPAGFTHAEGAAPGTREYFERVLQKRSAYEMPWLFDLVPFASFGGKQVLELGCGAGYDAYEICRNGADYIGIDLAPINLWRTRTHLGFYDLSPKVAVGDAEFLMWADRQFDVVFSNGVLHHTPDMLKSFCEAERVLRPGGEFWVILYHKHSVFHWVSLFLVNYLLRGGFRRRTFRQQLSMIECSTSGALPLVNVYSRQEVADHLQQAGFRVDSLWVRKLVREDLPSLPILRRLYCYVPQPVLDWVGKAFGWYVIAKASKA